MRQAHAMIILCDKKSSDPEAEDASNITRYIYMTKICRSVTIEKRVDIIKKQHKRGIR